MLLNIVNLSKMLSISFLVTHPIVDNLCPALDYENVYSTGCVEPVSLDSENTGAIQVIYLLLCYK